MQNLLKRYGEHGLSRLHEQLLEIDAHSGPCTQIYKSTIRGITDFAKLESLAGSRDKTLSLCKQARQNLYWLLEDDNYKKLEEHGLMDRVVPDEDVEELVWGCNHMPECMGGECVGCRMSTTI
ncbi:hypothetical protein Slin14017_G113600 [Septoria linicola]|nr:hypothetical protein Slin14017_G113600 [Septoria linicola]